MARQVRTALARAPFSSLLKPAAAALATLLALSLGALAAPAPAQDSFELIFAGYSGIV